MSVEWDDLHQKIIKEHQEREKFEQEKKKAFEDIEKKNTQGRACFISYRITEDQFNGGGDK
jgi:hypothetical protein